MLGTIGMMSALAGFDVMVSPFMFPGESRQVRFPRSKKKRIRKKWRKQQRNFKVFHEPKFMRMGSKIITNPCGYDQLRKEFQPRTSRYEPNEPRHDA